MAYGYEKEKLMADTLYDSIVPMLAFPEVEEGCELRYGNNDVFVYVTWNKGGSCNVHFAIVKNWTVYKDGKPLESTQEECSDGEFDDCSPSAYGALVRDLELGHYKGKSVLKLYKITFKDLGGSHRS